jgi:DNA polymerase-3 subunit beta
MIVKTKLLLEALKSAKKCICSNSLQPVLHNVLLEKTNYTLKICSTDLSLFYLKTIPVLTYGDFDSITVNCDFLLKVITNIKDENIELIEKEGYLIIKTLKTNYNINSIDAKKFPEIPDTDDYIQCLTDISSDTLKKISVCAGNNGYSDILSYVNYNPSTGKLAACDGDRLLVFDTKQIGEKEINIPKQVINNLSNGNYNISVKNDYVILHNDTEKYICYSIDGIFPRYEQLIPQNNNVELLFKSDNVIDALKEIKTTLNERTNILKINITGTSVYFSTESPDKGKSETCIESKLNNIENLKYNTLALNYKYVQDFTKQAKEITLCLNPTSNLSALVVKYDDFVGSIMPIQIK